jgi:hypothetical protein
MKHFGLMGIIIGAVIAGYPLSAIASRNSSQREGIEIEGVRAYFDMKNPVVCRGDHLTIRLRLQNVSKNAVRFSFLPAFVLHTRVYNSNHQQMYQRSDAPILEPVRRDLSLGPGQEVTIDNKLDLPLYYDLPPGHYYLKFFYDLRLIDNQKAFERYRTLYHSSDYVPWESKFYPFTIK